MIIQPIGAPQGRKDVSCCWFALGSLWKLLEDYSDEDMVSIAAPNSLEGFGPRGGHGDFSSVGVHHVTVPDIPLSPQSIPAGQWDINGLTMSNGEDIVEVSEGSMVKFVAFTGMTNTGNKMFSVVSGSYPVGDYRRAIEVEKKWWENTLGWES